MTPHKLTRSLITFFCLLLWTVTAFAGDEWKPLSPNEIALKTPVVEKDADAEILLWEVRADDTSQDLVLKHYLRIKIFNEKGREKFSKIEVEYANGKQIKDMAARVTKADGTTVELKKEDVFERTIVKVGGVKLKQKSFAAPGLEPGAILEYRYREVVENGRADLDLVFQREVPIHNVAYYVRPSSSIGSLYAQYFNIPQTFAFAKDKGGYYKAALTNVPSIHTEPYMLPQDDVRTWCSIFYLPIEGELTADKYWSRALYVVKELLEDGLKPNDDVKKMAAEITAKATTPEEKLALLYEYCQTQIKNLDFDYKLTDDDRKKLKTNNKPSETLKRRQGESLDINQLFFAMAKASGFETRMLMAADRSKKLFESKMVGPFLHVAAAAVKVNDRWRFYCPGRPYVQIGMLPWYEEGQDSMLLGNKDYLQIKTPISGPNRSVAKRSGKFRLLEDGTLEGDVRMEFTGHLNFERKLTNDEDSPAKREETLRDEIKTRLSTAELSEVKVENVVEPGKPFTYTFKVKVPSYAQRTGKRLFLQPNFFEANTTPAFTSGERKYKIYINYPWIEEDNLTIELPDGYALDNADVPEPIAVEGISADNVSISTDGKTLAYKRQFFFGSNSDLLIFSPNQYTAIKKFFEGINKVDTHTLTLKAK